MDTSSSDLYSDEDDIFDAPASAGDDYERRSQIYRKQFTFLEKIEAGEYDEPKLLEQEVVENANLKMKGDNGSTILHVMVARWSSAMEAPFAAIMKTYPDLYLVEDDLKRTALEKAEDGLREAKNYVEFFATNFSEATVNLLRGEKSHIMDILLRVLRNIAAWETLLRQLGTKALEHKWDGNPLLHRTVAYIATCTRSDNQFAILLDVVKAILRHVPESITQMNQQNLSAYQLHHQLHQNLLEEERQREEERRLDRREEERQLARGRRHEAEGQRGESTKPDNSLAKKSSVDFEKHIAPETLGLIRRSSIVSLPKDRPANNPKDIEDVESTSKFGTERSYKIRTRKKKATFSDLKSRVNKTLARFLQLELLRKVDAKDIPILLYHENEEMEFDLDLSEMAQGKGMEDQQSSRDVITTIRSLSFGEILRFVRIPGDLKPINTASRMYSDRIIGILKHLSEKGVRYIIRLEAGSDPDLAESDEAIIELLKPFKLDELDWKKTDISSHVLLEAVPDVRRLHLYSSGNLGVLKSWAATDGLCKLSKLNELTISVMSRTEPLPALYDYTKKFEEMIQKCLQSPLNIRIRVLSYNPNKGWLAALSDTEPTKVFETRQDWADRLSRIGESVSKFAGSSSSTSVKIAMIGDGLARFSEQIMAGRSFIQDGESGFRSLKPFYLSSTNHGARMAEIIIQACQSAHIYVARVTDIGHGSTEPLLIQNIARAIEWAIHQGVDIIYLGVELKWSEPDLNDKKRFELSLFEANARKIPVITPTIKKDIGTSLRADLRHLVLQIAPARKSSGIQLNWESDEQDYDFMMPGEITLNGEQGVAYGGSIAAAFATGLAATLMLAAKLINSQIEIREVFEALSSRTRTRFVFLDELKIEEGEQETFNNLTRFLSKGKSKAND